MQEIAHSFSYPFSTATNTCKLHWLKATCVMSSPLFFYTPPIMKLGVGLGVYWNVHLSFCLPVCLSMCPSFVQLNRETFCTQTCSALTCADMMKQGQDLSVKPHIVISTPGRLADHLDSCDTFSLGRVKFLVRCPCSLYPFLSENWRF